MEEKMRNSGIDVIGSVLYGTYICHFYNTKEDLKDILLPYFKTGLENNDLCIWIASQPLEAEEAKEVLKRAIPDFNTYLEKGQLEIISYTYLHLADSIYDSEKVINERVEKLNHALKSGYRGLRLSENFSWVEKKDWGYFVDYMRKMSDVIYKYRMTALDSYFIDRCNTPEVIEIVSSHQFSLIKKEGKWEKTDNSRWRKTEEAAIRATQDWKHTFDAVPDLISIIDTNYRIVRANKSMAKRLGMTPEECVGLTCYRIVHRTDEPPSFCPHKLLLNDENEHIVEACEDCLGGYFIVSVSPMSDSEGKLTGSIHVARDINELKKSEEALRKAHASLEAKVKERTAELEKTYKSLKDSDKGLAETQKMAHIGNWEWDIAADKAYWSEEMYRIFGRSPQKSAPPYKEYLSYTHPDDQEHFDNAHKKAVAGEPYNFDHRIISDNGEERTIHIQCEVIFNDGIPIRLKGIVQDITERKKDEEKIQSLANIVESSNDAIITISLDGIITSWNKSAEQIYGYLSEDIMGKSASLPAPNHLKGEVMQLIEKVKQGEDIRHYETTRVRKDGRIIYVSIALSPVLNTYGKLVAISAISRDISHRIETERSIMKAEEARKKEIHHRIKNNLQVISSLLDLQAEKFRDKEVLEAFRESQSRVLSMSFIHEELYKGEGTDTLDFSIYLRKLAKNLFQTYSLSSKNINLFMDLEEDTFLDMDTAIPLGIIVNELISNALKHAFTGKTGEIRIRLSREGENDEMNNSFYSLIISDNGKGLPENLKLEYVESLGLRLVNILVDQLDGSLEFKRNQGTEFRIGFRVTAINRTLK